MRELRLEIWEWRNKRAEIREMRELRLETWENWDLKDESWDMRHEKWESSDIVLRFTKSENCLFKTVENWQIMSLFLQFWDAPRPPEQACNLGGKCGLKFWEFWNCPRPPEQAQGSTVSWLNFREHWSCWMKISSFANLYLWGISSHESPYLYTSNHETTFNHQSVKFCSIISQEFQLIDEVSSRASRFGR